MDIVHEVDIHWKNFISFLETAQIMFEKLAIAVPDNRAFFFGFRCQIDFFIVENF